MYRIMVVGLIFGIVSTAEAQQFSDTIRRTLRFEKQSTANALIISNINGDISVVGYEGDQVVVEVDRRISAKTNSRLEEGKSEIQLGVIDRVDTLILYVEGTCSQFGRSNQRYHRNEKAGRGWNYNWSGREDDCNEGYDFLMHFTIKVPSSTNLELSTINDGEITVSNVTGKLYADNINGGIKLTKISGPTSASTINGDVDLEYIENPEMDCRYYSLNGDINALYRKGLGASVSFESFNGDFFTNVNSIESIPVTLEREERKDGTKYKINGNRYKIGPGGVRLDFETFNGNVYLKEI